MDYFRNSDVLFSYRLIPEILVSEDASAIVVGCYITKVQEWS